jgi:hypothetical protein
MKPIIFHVEAGGQIRPVELAFATEAEVKRIRTWRGIKPATDAGEFAGLAAKRWFYYARDGATMPSLDKLRNAIGRNGRGEFAFLMVASAAWAKRQRVLGLAYCRRSWCHHLILEFLAVRPGLSFASQPIRGVGSGVLFGLVSLATTLGVELIWGEATANSASFYEKVLQIRPVQDLFVIHQEAMCGIRDRYLENQNARLAKLGARAHTL